MLESIISIVTPCCYPLSPIHIWNTLSWTIIYNEVQLAIQWKVNLSFLQPQPMFILLHQLNFSSYEADLLSRLLVNCLPGELCH